MLRAEVERIAHELPHLGDASRLRIYLYKLITFTIGEMQHTHLIISTHFEWVI